jgi:threonine dehydratase
MTPDAIRAAHQRIAPYIRTTPCIDLSILPGTSAQLKLEMLQVSGTFKARGAFTFLTAAMADATKAQALKLSGVVAASGGNHGIAVAYAAKTLGVPAHIFVPETAPAAKRAKLAALGARVVAQGAAYNDALLASQLFASQHGGLQSHAFDHVDTLTGQATLALEWEQQLANANTRLDTVLVAVGGGGLIGGICAWWGERIKIVAVESVGCPTLHAALAHGTPQDITVSGIAADSLGAKRVGQLMFPLAQRHVRASVLVPEAQIVSTQTWCWEHLRLMVEPGGATALAALLHGHYQPQPGERVGVLMCGSNVDPLTVNPL